MTDIPTVDEALARLNMPLLDAMMTQRAVRRVLPDPVDDAIVLKCIELALRAPTGSNGQNWEFVVVKDRAVKAAVRQALPASLGRSTAQSAGGSPPATSRCRKTCGLCNGRSTTSSEIPVLVVPCLRAGMRLPYAPSPFVGETSFFGSIYPSVQNLLLAARAMGWRIADHAAAVECDVGPPNPRPAAHGHSRLHGPTRLAAGTLRADDAKAGRRGDAPRRIRQAGLAGRLRLAGRLPAGPVSSAGPGL